MRVSVFGLHYNSTKTPLLWKNVFGGIPAEATVWGNQPARIETMRFIPAVLNEKRPPRKTLKRKREEEFKAQLKEIPALLFEIPSTGPHLYPKDWGDVLPLLERWTLYARKGQSSSDDAILLQEPITLGDRRKQHLVLFQYRNYLENTSVGTGEIIDEVEKALPKELTDLECFCSLVLITNSANVNIGKIQEGVTDTDRYAIVKGESRICQVQGDRSCKLPMNSELIVFKKGGVATILPGLS
eukprot:gb/GECG01001172.1/.p1 GENE.gb/GECG01001172.1/~~gb/GECG01001172.1/.p1  ORF type:complete len:242 (+),score=21.17 gb/GECG01001172.1/:1-726(+)